MELLATNNSLTRGVKSKIDQKCRDAVQAELCGADFASHLNKYVDQHTQIKVKRWHHLILGAIQHESYGFRTFFANRTEEIQSSTQLLDWWWIPGQINVANIITRGAGPKELDVDSQWQQGPEFLCLPENE